MTEDEVGQGAEGSTPHVEAVAVEEPRRRFPEEEGSVPHLTPAERSARGKAARKEVPRSSHAVWEPPPGRPDPIALLQEQAASRVPDLVPIRYGRMAASAFAFYRGAALIMASDLSSTPRSGLNVQLCGDAHLSNFGVYTSPERTTVFDMNDFDETLPGPWEWDVKRLAASFVIAARENGFARKDVRASALSAVREYREAMQRFAGRPNLDVWYQHLKIDALLQRMQGQVNPRIVRRAEQNLAKSRTRDSLHAYAKLVEQVDGAARIRSDPPLIVPVRDLVGGDPEQLADEIRRILRTYRETLQVDRRHILEQYRFVDLARKVVGVGSVGTRAFIVLMLGRDETDPLFLQVKEAQPSVLERFLAPSEYTNAGQRVVTGQRITQAASDIFLGWIRVKGIDGVMRDFYVRQLRDGKGSAIVESMLPTGMQIYGRICGWTLARAHARSGDRIAIASYLGTSDSFDHAVVAFAEAYADQNDRDHAALVQAIASGRVEAQTGV